MLVEKWAFQHSSMLSERKLELMKEYELDHKFSQNRLLRDKHLLTKHLLEFDDLTTRFSLSFPLEEPELYTYKHSTFFSILHLDFL